MFFLPSLPLFLTVQFITLRPSCELRTEAPSVSTQVRMTTLQSRIASTTIIAFEDTDHRSPSFVSVHRHGITHTRPTSACEWPLDATTTSPTIRAPHERTNVGDSAGPHTVHASPPPPPPYPHAQPPSRWNNVRVPRSYHRLTPEPAHTHAGRPATRTYICPSPGSYGITTLNILPTGDIRGRGGIKLVGVDVLKDDLTAQCDERGRSRVWRTTEKKIRLYDFGG